MKEILIVKNVKKPGFLLLSIVVISSVLLPFLFLSLTQPKIRLTVIAPDAHECSLCFKPIFGLFILIEGKYFHPEHFKCTACGVDCSAGNRHQFQSLFFLFFCFVLFCFVLFCFVLFCFVLFCFVLFCLERK